jgi:diacylglycerol kinase (ATP)
LKALFLVNERSGARRNFDVEEVIRQTCSWSHEIVGCQRKEDLDGILDTAERHDVDVVFAVGGDGTVHETAKRLVHRTLALGILPIGSGNGFARHIGLPLDPKLTLGACSAGRIVTIDTAEVNGTAFLGVMGIGFDALIADRFAASKVRGWKTYVKEGLFAFRHFRAEDYVLTTPEGTIRKNALVIAIANSGQYGNNARIAPLASLTDGLLDVVAISDVSFIGALVLLRRLFDGTIGSSPHVTMLRAASLRVERTNAGPAHLDGEPFLMGRELNVRVVPRSLRLLVPDRVTPI